LKFTLNDYPNDLRQLSVECKKSVESLNKIREELFLKHDGYKLYKMRSYENIIMLQWSKDIQDILSLIDSAIELYNFKFEKSNRIKFLSEIFLERLSNDKLLTFFDYNIDKAPYIKFLYSLQDAESKLIPILEVIGGTKEEGFLFRLKDNRGNIIVVWENINQGRATIYSSSVKKVTLIVSYHIFPNMKILKGCI